MYYHKNNFNGVLILMREPHISQKDKGQPVEEIERKSHEWITKVLNQSFTEADFAECKDEKERRSARGAITKYYNRFCELLTLIGKSAETLPQIAYTNLHKEGGGATVDESYKAILNKFNFCEFKEMIKPISNLEYILTCGDIFEKLQSILPSNGCPDCSNLGLKYPSGRKRAMKYENVTIYEIAHPSRSPKLEKLTK